MVKCYRNLPFRGTTMTKRPHVIVVGPESDSLHLRDPDTLKAAGYEVSAFTDPVKAIDYFRDNADHCPMVVSDIHMLGMNGFEFARLVRRIRPDTKVVFTTPFEVNRPEFESVFPKLQVDAIIQKPISAGKLLDIVESRLTVEFR